MEKDLIVKKLTKIAFAVLDGFINVSISLCIRFFYSL